MTDIHKLFSLHGRVAVVTGATGIYGIPIAEALAEAGAMVVMTSLDVARAEACARDLQTRGYLARHAYLDLDQIDSINQVRDQILAEHGRIDVLVNNAVARPMRKFTDPIKTWQASMTTNATGLFAICRAFLEPMMEAQQGSMINISSIQGVCAPDFENYAGTQMSTPPDYHFHKHGMLGLTRYLAALAGPARVRVNAISPGAFDTGDHPPRYMQQYHRRQFLKRLAAHDDIKGAIVYLASDASQYVTGQNLIVDGGYSC